MNFFEHQEQARKKTTRLIFYFILAIVFIILAIDVLCIAVLFYLNDPTFANLIMYGRTHEYHPQGMLFKPNIDMLIQLAWHLALYIAPFVIAIICIGSLFRMLRLRGGGISVANMAGATPIDPNTSDPLEQRFIHVVEEMSIASGIPIPKLYVMKNEPNINAFVAGMKPEDTVMVTTQGALEQLNRDELQGVVGHEYSHIFNSDMQINLKLMGIVGGLILISQVGFFILRCFGANSQTYRASTPARDPRSRSSFSVSSSSSTDTGSGSGKGGNLVVAILFLGVGIYAIGYIGVFFGRLIKAAISRQRELLADACSVQYTREPSGLIRALAKIQKSENASYLNTPRTEDINHLCFSPAMEIYFSSLLATHPPLDYRIKTLDPDGYYPRELEETASIRKTEKKERIPQQPNLVTATAILAGSILTTKKDIKSSIGNPSQAHIVQAQNLLQQIPEEAKNLAHDPQKVSLLFYALIFPLDPNKKEAAVAILTTVLKEEEISLVTTLAEQLNNISKNVLFPIIDIAIPAFNTHSIQNKTAIYQICEKLFNVDNTILFKFMMLEIIYKHIEQDSSQNNTANIESCIHEISTLIAFIIYCSHKNESEGERSYINIMRQFTKQNIPQPVITAFKPIQMQIIFTKLNTLSPICKEQLLHGCLECIEDDNIITIEEAEIIRAIAACLDCPIPPILPTVMLAESTPDLSDLT